MSKNINVSELAKSLYPKLDEIFNNEFEKVIQEISATENREKQESILLSGMQQTIKNHCERFTIEIVQKVADELTSK